MDNSIRAGALVSLIACGTCGVDDCWIPPILIALPKRRPHTPLRHVLAHTARHPYRGHRGSPLESRGYATRGQKTSGSAVRMPTFSLFFRHRGIAIQCTRPLSVSLAASSGDIGTHDPWTVRGPPDYYSSLVCRGVLRSPRIEPLDM